MKRWVKCCDILSPKTSFFYEGKKRYYSCIGIVMSLFWIVISLSFGIYLFVCFIEGSEMSVSYFKDYRNFQAEVNFSEKLFFYSVKSIGDTNPTSKYFEIHPVYWSNNKPETLVETSCKKKNYLDRNNSNLNLDEYKCLERSNGQNIQLNSISLGEGNYISISINKCKNTTLNKNHCFSNDVIEKKIKEEIFFFSFFGEDIFIQNEKSQPLLPILRRKSLSLSSDYGYIYNYDLRKYRYESDNGILIKSIKTYEDFGVEDKPQLQKIFPRESYSEDPLLVLKLSINGDYIKTYQRTYQKFPSLIANIGGIGAVFYLISLMLTYFFSRGSIVLYLSQASMTKGERITLNLLKLGETTELKSFNNFMKTKQKSNFNTSTSQTNGLQELTKSTQEKYCIFEMILYKCWSRRKNCQIIRELETKVIKLLDIRNYLFMSKELNVVKFDSTGFSLMGPQKKELSYIGILKKSTSIKSTKNFETEMGGYFFDSRLKGSSKNDYRI